MIYPVSLVFVVLVTLLPSGKSVAIENLPLCPSDAPCEGDCYENVLGECCGEIFPSRVCRCVDGDKECEDTNFCEGADEPGFCDSFGCPATPPTPGERCNGEWDSCSYGTETCCAETFASETYRCNDGIVKDSYYEGCFTTCDDEEEEFECPESPPNPSEECSGEWECSYGSETCCGDTFDSATYRCNDGIVKDSYYEGCFTTCEDEEEEFECPESPPNPFDECSREWECSYGTETCCGETFDSTTYRCEDGIVKDTSYEGCFKTCDGECPASPPNPMDECSGDWDSCSYGTETCCGEIFASATYTCIDGIVKDSYYEGCLETCEDDCKDGCVVGDPHFGLWNGQWYDFHHICDLVLLKIPDKDVQIHIRTKARYQYSFIETAVIQVGDDVLEVSGFGIYTLNGISHAGIPDMLADDLYPVSYKQRSPREQSFEIQMNPKSGTHDKIVINAFKDVVSVKVKNATKAIFGSSVGLMGSFEDGAMLGRDGVTIMDDPIAFGTEWQVLESETLLFQTDRYPQHPQTCTPPDKASNGSRIGRRLGEAVITKEQAQEACAHWSDEHKDFCVYDVLAMDDLELAEAGAY